jgi:acyl-coenzyme A synthetase/AMP-(fatty) acid ligase
MFLCTHENTSSLDAICDSSERRLLKSAKTSVNPTVSFLVGHSFIYLLQFYLLLTFFTSPILFSSNNTSSVSSSGSSCSRYYLSSLHTAFGDTGQLNHRGINQVKENICIWNETKRCHVINTWTCTMGTPPSNPTSITVCIDTGQQV